MREEQSLTVVIVSYNVRRELEACLTSLLSDAKPFPTEVVVVDNASDDATPAAVRNHWPAVRLIEAGTNLGFARATNLGIRATHSGYVLLLNPDTIVPPGAVTALVQGLAAHPKAAVAGPRLVDELGFAELSFGWAIGPLGELRQKVVGSLYNRRVRSVVRRVDRWTREPGLREWVSGACLLVRRSDLEAIGLLDERYFMYAEDVDLCVALRQRGRDILFMPDVEVRHLRGRSAAGSPHTERLRRASQMAYYAKHHPRWVPLLQWYQRLSGKRPR